MNNLKTLLNIENRRLNLLNSIRGLFLICRTEYKSVNIGLEQRITIRSINVK
jgi:hypothetical protein